MFNDSYGVINVEGYRQAKNRVKRKKLGIYIKKDGFGKPVIYLMHKTQDGIYLVSSKAEIPGYFVKGNHKKDYGYYYIRLIGKGLDKWIKYMEGTNEWRYF